jgi:cytidine deaminase
METSLHERLAEKLRDAANSGRLTNPKDIEMISDLVRSVVAASPLQDITEYGRAVHAELAAILAAGRVGAPVRGATLYCTTFPCHNCAKHIVAAGVGRVVFVEPYPKSKAIELHGDAIDLVGDSTESASAYLTDDIGSRRTRFEPFLGVGPRRYFDLFSMRLGAGTPLRRKDKKTGRKLIFEEAKATPRIQLSTVGYLWREGEAVDELANAMATLGASATEGG